MLSNTKTRRAAILSAGFSLFAFTTLGCGLEIDVPEGALDFDIENPDQGGGSRREPDGDGQELCSNSCYWADDGVCDDGGHGAEYVECDLGTDCNDCGPRYNDGGSGDQRSFDDDHGDDDYEDADQGDDDYGDDNSDYDWDSGW